MAKEKEEKAKVNKEGKEAEAEKVNISMYDKLALLEERNPTRLSKKKCNVSSSGAVVPKKNKSKNKVKGLQDQPSSSTNNYLAEVKALQSHILSSLQDTSGISKKEKAKRKKEKAKIKRLQDKSTNSKPDRNKIFQGLRAAGESIKETMKGQVDKVKNLLKPTSKKGAGQSFSEVISKEGVQVGLTLDPYLLDLAEVERVQKEVEENWEEDLMLWEEGWGRDFKLTRVTGQEEEEDLRSPHWEDVKEAATDKARKALARIKFSNPVCSDPTSCLTFHGFKGRSHDLENAIPGSFNICEGQRLPLAGAKRKGLDSIDNPTPSKVVKLFDFNQVMQSRCAEYLARSRRQKKCVLLDHLPISEGLAREFSAALNQLKNALHENDNFLQYYSDRKGAFLSHSAALEALDLEETSALWKSVYQTVAPKPEPEVTVLDSEPDVIVLD